jgi:hypothetical protein
MGIACMVVGLVLLNLYWRRVDAAAIPDSAVIAGGFWTRGDLAAASCDSRANFWSNNRDTALSVANTP